MDERSNDRRSLTIREVEGNRNMNGKSKLENLMGQLAEITASKPMGRIRGKNEVSGPRKSKERSNEPSGPIWPASPSKERGMAEIGTQWAIRAKALV